VSIQMGTYNAIAGYLQCCDIAVKASRMSWRYIFFSELSVAISLLAAFGSGLPSSSCAASFYMPCLVAHPWNFCIGFPGTTTSSS
jgi:hypothetical protein